MTRPAWAEVDLGAVADNVRLLVERAAPAQLKPFTATYEVSYMGIGGTGTMTLAPAGGDRWNYRLEIESAVATLSQRTTFAANGGAWRPLSNDDSSSLLIRKNSRQATYDWTSREARWSGDVKPDRSGPVALRDGDLDAMLVNLAIPRDLDPAERAETVARLAEVSRHAPSFATADSGRPTSSETRSPVA